MYRLDFLENWKNRKVFDRWSNTFVVYLLTNNSNNKKYVGITKHIKTRIHEHLRYSKSIYKVSMYIHRAIKKYGLNKFSIKILRKCENYDDLNKWESFYIKKYKSNNNEYGYNLTSGGKAGIPNDVTTLKKIQSSKKIKVGQYDLNGNLIKMYESVMDASRQLNIKNTDIHRCCKNKWTRNGFMFFKSKSHLPKKIAPFKSNRGINFEGKSNLPHNAISGYLININTNEKFYGKSIVEISKKSGISKDSIFRIKKGGHKKYVFVAD